MKFKLSLLLTAFISVALYFYSQGLITQPQSYHDFADKRALFGIPNAMDVLTNVFFLFVGALGLFEILNHQETLLTKKSWFWFFLSIIIIAPGSTYYHWSPNDETLLWDRLPMSMGFMAMYVALCSEHIDLRVEKGLYPALITGLFSVLIWVISSDLRFYFTVQFSTFVTVPLVLALFPSRYSNKFYYIVALMFYALAKFVEVKDYEIFDSTNHLMSGHSLKHILAATGLLFLWKMIHTRQEILLRA